MLLVIRREIVKGKVVFEALVFRSHGDFGLSMSCFLSFNEVMELCAGGDLDKHMQKQNKPYTERQAPLGSIRPLPKPFSVGP